MKLRELVGLARERLGERAVDLKTREELEVALFGPPAGDEAPPQSVAVRSAVCPVVTTKDFFVLPT
jgi:hypothetical protein